MKKANILSKRRVIHAMFAVAVTVLPQWVAAQPQVTMWKATEVWRTDGGEGAEPFADLRDIVALKDGTVWALDFKFQTIRRYSAAGKPLGIIARQGRGPGEISNANGMVVRNDGGVWVNDANNARISVFSAEGKFVRQFLAPFIGCQYHWTGWVDRKTGALAEQKLGRDASGWRRFDTQGKPMSDLPNVECPSGKFSAGSYQGEQPGTTRRFGSTYPFGNGGGLAPDGNGNAWCASAFSDRVALVTMTPKMDTIALTTLAIPNMPVGKAERDEAVARAEKQLANYPINNFDKSKVADSKPGIAGLHVDAVGRLWVQHNSIHGRRSTTFDVFDAQARHLGRVVVPARTNSYLPIRAQGNLLWLIVFDEDDVQYVAHYRLER